ncbi:MAG: hypothetical protein Q9160_008274 [Pyrenula sp. 1 TL-2023]
MDEIRSPASSQENVDLQNLPRPKKPPTVTPRRFKKFFTPRQTSGAVRTSRKALQDITKPVLNYKSDIQVTSSLSVFSDPPRTEGSSKRKRRRLSASSVDHAPQSSPLKRVTFEQPSSQDDSRGEALAKGFDRLEDDDDDDLLENLHEPILSRRRIKTYKNFGTSAAILASRVNTRRQGPCLNFNVDYEAETAPFSSSSQDVHFCNNGGSGSSYTLPFCTASCNTNSLVAIGDEEGGVRLIDSAKEDKIGFSKAFLSFHPHDNAIMDLTLSNDDALLATASGDQTSLIIDMPTQKTVACLTGHESSIKQVRFQPGSNDKVLATCGRDGSVHIWDMRCRDTDPSLAVVRNVNNHQIDLADPPRYPSTINKIRHAHPSLPFQATSSTFITANSTTTKRHRPTGPAPESSITSLAFLPAPRSHLFLTASSSTSHIRLWDLRTTYTTRRTTHSSLSSTSNFPTPLSTTSLPPSHLPDYPTGTRSRNYGITSLVLDSSSSPSDPSTSTTLYASSRDHTIYAYNTSHLILGSAPDLSLTPSSNPPPPRRLASLSPSSYGLRPIYALRHPQLRISSFYIKLSLRKPSPANDYATPILAAGSSDNCAVLFPTSPQYLRPENRTDTGSDAGIPVYAHGTPLISGHQKEVTSVSWTHGGDLVSVGDDFLGRCWRDGRNYGSGDGKEARELRRADGGRRGELEGGRRWLAGWADVSGEADDDEWD